MKAYSVRLKEFTPVKGGFRAVAFDGSSAWIPEWAYCGPDFSVSRSEAYWIAAKVLETRQLQYSIKKSADFYKKGSMWQMVEYKVEKFVPERITPQQTKPDEDLVR